MPAIVDASLPQPVTSTTITVGCHSFVMTERPQLDDTSLQQWPAGQMLSEYIAAHSDSVTGKRVLELGAGCGLAGMAAVKAGAKMVLLTDRKRSWLTNRQAIYREVQHEPRFWNGEMKMRWQHCRIRIECPKSIIRITVYVCCIHANTSLYDVCCV